MTKQELISVLEEMTKKEEIWGIKSLNKTLENLLLTNHLGVLLEIPKEENYCSEKYSLKNDSEYTHYHSEYDRENIHCIRILDNEKKYLIRINKYEVFVRRHKEINVFLDEYLSSREVLIRKINNNLDLLRKKLS